MVLTYINPLNKNYKGEHTYEFLFSKTNEINFGDDWDVAPASSGSLTPPPVDEIDIVGILKTDEIELDLAIFSDNFSMYDCVENVIALGWEKESPNNEIRLVFHFGETIESVKEKLYSRDKIMKIVKETQHEEN
jgi:hypothetical protein